MWSIETTKARGSAEGSRRTCGHPRRLRALLHDARFRRRLSRRRRATTHRLHRERFGIDASLTTCTQVHGATVRAVTRAWSNAIPATRSGPTRRTSPSASRSRTVCRSRYRSRALASSPTSTPAGAAPRRHHREDARRRRATPRSIPRVRVARPAIRVCCFEVGEEVVEQFAVRIRRDRSSTARTRSRTSTSPRFTATILRAAALRRADLRLRTLHALRRLDLPLVSPRWKGAGGRNLAIASRSDSAGNRPQTTQLRTPQTGIRHASSRSRLSDLVLGCVRVVDLGCSRVAFGSTSSRSASSRCAGSRSRPAFTPTSRRCPRPPLQPDDLLEKLDRLGYREVGALSPAGRYDHVDGGSRHLHARVRASQRQVPRSRSASRSRTAASLRWSRCANARDRDAALEPELLTSILSEQLENRRPVTLAGPAALQDAVVVTEDIRFWHHPGVDPLGIFRARLPQRARARRGRRRLDADATAGEELLPHQRAHVQAQSVEAFMAVILDAKYSKKRDPRGLSQRHLPRPQPLDLDHRRRRGGALLLRQAGRGDQRRGVGAARGMIRSPNNYSPFAEPGAGDAAGATPCSG